MNFSAYFVDRPIFASVLSILILVLGAIALPILPIAEYPEVVPPSVVVTASFPGASPEVIADTVASPLEQAINGVENMLYMDSKSTSDGSMKLTVTFRLGANADLSQILVQNRVNQALPKLPEETRRIGVTTVKSVSDLTMVVHLVAEDGRYDPIYLRNYASLQVKDALARLPGVGQVLAFGPGDYAMRVWINPDQAASYSLTAGDIIRALREQNVQVAAGTLGAPPTDTVTGLQLALNAPGRLTHEVEFGEVVVKVSEDGSLVRLRDVARIELGAGSYALRSLLNGQAAIGLPVFQSPGSNALALSAAVRTTMAELAKDFPEGLGYRIVYDPTVFVRESIEAVVHTLFEAILLVVVVVIVFLQTWRASIIPLVAVPVSVIGTFAVMWALGFSINTLTLFGLVLAIGIVVDDAIVVVENVERNIATGLAPREAAFRAMQEVSGPIIAVALVLCAVFIPVALVPGLTGQFYRQFAVTIAISTVISAFNSLTLSPALAALLLRPHHAPPDVPTRILNTLLGWFFSVFNAVFHVAASAYAALVGLTVHHRRVLLLGYLGLIVATVQIFQMAPTGFVPGQDKAYLITIAKLPPAASLNRTEAVMRRMSELAHAVPGVKDTVIFPGLSINGFTNAPNSGIMFVPLKPFDERREPSLSGGAIAQALNKAFASIEEAACLALMPPPVRGLGTVGGFKLQLLDRNGAGETEMTEALNRILLRARQDPRLTQVFSGFDVNTPQLDLVINREKAKVLGVPLGDLFETLQVYLGSLYVNDFNRFGRTYQVIAQADTPFRMNAEAIKRMQTRTQAGEMLPLGTLVELVDGAGPDRVEHYNAYRSADLNGAPAPGVSGDTARYAMESIVREELPSRMGFDWTELVYQQLLVGDSGAWVFPLCVLLVFLVLAAQYESLVLPFAIILIVPLCLLSALTGVLAEGGDNNIFTQVGLVVLMGLACKNAILIVEFARDLELTGMSVVAAAREAARLRLRPILMTSFAFIMGVLPLAYSVGAGAEMRQALGVAVASGMLGVTLFGLVLTPLFYVVLRSGLKSRAGEVA